MKREEFYLQHDGMRIHCKLDYPATMQSPENKCPEDKCPEDKCPLLILEHGFTGHMEETHIVAIAEQVVSIGFAVLRVELYGHGKSDGAFRDHTVLKWVNQMLAVVSYAASLSFVTDLYLAGHSQGGLTAMLVAALERDRIKALLPLSPAILIRDSANKGQMLGYEFDPRHIPDEIVSPDGRALGEHYFRTAQLLPIEESIRRYDRPVLIVHGDADEAVPVQYARDAAKLYADCTLKIIPGDTHCYDYHLDQVTAAISEFLLAQQQS